MQRDTEEYISRAVGGLPSGDNCGKQWLFFKAGRETELQIENIGHFLTHRHYYYVSVGMEHLCEKRGRAGQIL